MQGLQRAAQPQVRLSSFPLYDTARLTADSSGVWSSTTERLFATGVGNAGNGFSPKTLAETNMQKNGLALGSSYRVSSIGVSVYDSSNSAPTGTGDDAFDVAYDIQQIANGAVLQYESSSLLQTFGVLSMFPAGGGIVSSGNLGHGSSGTAIGSIGNNGIAAAGARFRLQQPLILREGQTFNWNIFLPRDITSVSGATSAAASYDVRVMLFGQSFQDVVE